MSDPKWTHEMDQAFASLAVMAATAARYYLVLVGEGVPADVALSLTETLQASLLRMSGVAK